MKLCKYSKDKSTKMHHVLWCIIINDVCGRYRFCTNDSCIKMINEYCSNGCIIEKMQDNKNKVVNNILK